MPTPSCHSTRALRRILLTLHRADVQVTRLWSATILHQHPGVRTTYIGLISWKNGSYEDEGSPSFSHRYRQTSLHMKILISCNAKLKPMHIRWPAAKLQEHVSTVFAWMRWCRGTYGM